MGNIKEGLSQLLNKQMDRREFLAHAGVMLLAAIGATRVLEAASISCGNYALVGLGGYGRTPYGG